MINKPVVSVVMPCFNSENYVQLAISSIINQDFDDFEFIIINDGSTDNTHLEVQKFKDARIRYINNKINQGNYSSRNHGHSIARGKYICVMDSDDIAMPNRLSVQVEYMKNNPKVGCVGAFAELIDQDGTTIGSFKHICDYSNIKTFLLKNNCFIHPTLMLRKPLLDKFGLSYNLKYKYSSDYDFMDRCSRLFPVKNINKILLKYRIHKNQITCSKQIEQREFATLIKVEQLKRFNIVPNKNEIDLHIKLMRGNYLPKAQLEHAVTWLNKLLQLNEIEKLYNQRSLYNLFNYCLGRAQTNAKS